MERAATRLSHLFILFNRWAAHVARRWRIDQSIIDDRQLMMGGKQPPFQKLADAPDNCVLWL
jgi:hypothetical protein